MKTVTPEINGTLEVPRLIEFISNLDFPSQCFHLEDHFLSIILVLDGRPLLIQEARTTSWNILIEINGNKSNSGRTWAGRYPSKE